MRYHTFIVKRPRECTAMRSPMRCVGSGYPLTSLSAKQALLHQSTWPVQVNGYRRDVASLIVADLAENDGDDPADREAGKGVYGDHFVVRG